MKITVAFNTTVLAITQMLVAIKLYHPLHNNALHNATEDEIKYTALPSEIEIDQADVSVRGSGAKLILQQEIDAFRDANTFTAFTMPITNYRIQIGTNHNDIYSRESTVLMLYGNQQFNKSPSTDNKIVACIEIYYTLKSYQQHNNKQFNLYFINNDTEGLLVPRLHMMNTCGSILISSLDKAISNSYSIISWLKRRSTGELYFDFYYSNGSII